MQTKKDIASAYCMQCADFRTKSALMHAACRLCSKLQAAHSKLYASAAAAKCLQWYFKLYKLCRASRVQFTLPSACSIFSPFPSAACCMSCIERVCCCCNWCCSAPDTVPPQLLCSSARVDTFKYYHLFTRCMHACTYVIVHVDINN